jgi:hypothetical protein
MKNDRQKKIVKFDMDEILKLAKIFHPHKIKIFKNNGLA